MKTKGSRRIKQMRAELEEELKIKKDQLKDKKARLNGGFSPFIKRDYLPIGKEIENISKVIRMRELETSNDEPIDPKFKFELNEEWRNLRRGFQIEETDKIKAVFEKLKTDRETISSDIEQLETRIDELHQEIGSNITVEEEEEKISYTG